MYRAPCTQLACQSACTASVTVHAPQEAKALKQQLKSMEALQALGSTMGLTPQVLQAIELAASSHHLYNPLPMTLHAYGGVLHPLAAGGAAPTQAQAQVLSALSPGLGPAQAQLHTYAAPPGQAMPWPPQPPVPSQQPAHLSNPAPTQQPPYNSYVNTHAQPGLAAAMPLADTTGAAAAAAAGQPGLGRAGADATPPGGQGPGMWGNYSTQQVQGAAGSLGLGSGGGTAAGQRLQPSQMLNGLGQQQQQYQQQQGMGRGAGGLFERAWAAPLCVVGCRVVALSPTGGWLLAPETREGGKAWVTKVSVPCPEVRPGSSGTGQGAEVVACGQEAWHAGSGGTCATKTCAKLCSRCRWRGIIHLSSNAEEPVPRLPRACPGPFTARLPIRPSPCWHHSILSPACASRYPTAPAQPPTCSSRPPRAPCRPTATSLPS